MPSLPEVNVSADVSVQINMEMKSGDDKILNAEAMEFLATLHRRYEKKRQQLLSNRKIRQAQLDTGVRPGFLVATEKEIRKSTWTVRGKNLNILSLKTRMSTLYHCTRFF